MKRLSLSALFALPTLLSLSISAGAQVSAVPAAMNFQGRLAKPDGTPVADGTYNVQFSVYNALTGGTLLWQRSVTGIPVKNGVFSTRLNFSSGYQNGATQASLFAASNVYLDLSLNGGASLVPRQSLVSVAYAMKADSVKDGAITNDSVANGTLTASKFAGGALSPGGAAGGSLTGTYPNPGIASDAITHSQLASDPASLNDVSGGYAYLTDNEYLDASSQSNTSLTTGFAWQSFTAETNGYLRSIGIYCGTNGGASVNVTFSLYNGEGLGGSVLSSQTVSVTGTNGINYFSLPMPLLLSKGTKYTWYLGNNSALKIGYGTGNPYPGGTADFGTGYDYDFSNYMSLNPRYSRLQASVEGAFAAVTASNSYTDGVRASASRPGYAAIYGYNGGLSSVYAGRFDGPVLIQGNLQVSGTLSKSAGSFKIDHPLDPANKTLSHSFVESPDMMNLYNGNIVTDAKGHAVVTLPQWFSALNKDFRYGLTVIGEFAQAIVEKKIVNNRFVIRTSKPHIEVSWQVTGIRNDAYAKAHRIPVEENKTKESRGTYLFADGFAPAKVGKK